jgi:hypothetical protein
MGTMNAFYVRAESEALTAALQGAFPTAKLQTGNGFTCADLKPDDFDPPKDALAKLSVDFKTDVVWLGFQSVVDAFQFHHWQAGALVRSLVYGCYGDEERTWEEVSGQAEPWEQAAIFDAKGLASAMEFAESERQKQELERIWRNRELVPGSFEPPLDARETARAAAIFYGFPGWETPGKPVPPLAPAPPVLDGPPPLPASGKIYQVRAHLVPRYFWTSASIDVYLDGRCILMTGGQMKLTGGYSRAFTDGGQQHLAELKWGVGWQHHFPYELWIDGKMVAQSRVPVENWGMIFIPATIIAGIMYVAISVGVFYLLSILNR